MELPTVEIEEFLEAIPFDSFLETKLIVTCTGRASLFTVNKHAKELHFVEMVF